MQTWNVWVKIVKLEEKETIRWSNIAVSLDDRGETKYGYNKSGGFYSFDYVFRSDEARWYFSKCLVAQLVKNPPAMQEMWIRFFGQKDPLEKGMATHSRILAWRIAWAEEPGGLQSMGSQRVRHDWATNTSSLHFKLLNYKSSYFIYLSVFPCAINFLPHNAKICWVS